MKRKGEESEESEERKERKREGLGREEERKYRRKSNSRFFNDYILRHK